MTGQGEYQLPDSILNEMINTARAAASRAYAPYSTFPVGASVLTADGTIVAGVNIENASYGLTVCGERVAVFRAAADGHRELRAVVVSAPLAPGTTPCGACRQVLNEFKPEAGDLTVVLDHGEGNSPDIIPLSALLPYAFGPRNLSNESSTAG